MRSLVTFDMPEVYSLETFKQGQEAILACLEKVHQQARRYPLVIPLLRELEEKLYIHWQFQSQKCLPRLEEFFSGRRHEERKLEFQRQELKELKIRALEFFDKYCQPTNSIAARNFPIVFMEFRRAVIEQIQVEGEHLLPLWEEFFNSQQSQG